MKDQKGKKRYKNKKQTVDDPILPHGMKLSEFLKLTQDRRTTFAGYVKPTAPYRREQMPDGSYETVQVHDGARPRMVAEDEQSKTQKRKANRTKPGDGNYGCQEKHRGRKDGRQAGGHRRKMGHSKHQTLKTCGAPFNKSLGYVEEQGRPGL